MPQNVYEVTMPFLEPGMEEATVGEWLKQDNEWVEQGEPLFMAITLKNVIEVLAEVDGRLQILVETGSTVEVQALLAKLWPVENDSSKPIEESL